MSLLVVGSVAFDDISTPQGRAENILGGSATYFSVTASNFVPVRVVAVVGEDFGAEEAAAFQGRPIDIAGLERAQGKTFRWRGEYNGDMNQARTLETQLNVFQHFSPKIPASYLETEFIFLGNIDPTLQLHVRQQLPQARLVACDTMNYWIQRTPEALGKTLHAVDMLVINENETRMISGIDNLRRAAAEVLKLGPKVLVVKRGEYGACLFQNGSIFFAPGYPLEQVFDPTGAGDTFAGGFMGFLASCKEINEANLRRGLIYGSVMASFAVEAFGLRRLLRVTTGEIQNRFQEFKSMTHFDV